MRVAAVDIGTNTALLLVAEQGADGSLSAVIERATITRLGEGVDRTRRLAPAAIERTCACLDDYAELVSRAGVSSVAVVATSAMRDAQGGEALRAHVRAALGTDVRVLDGKEEARLAFCGARSGLPREGSGTDACEVAVFDIGGGSTEIVIGSDRGAPGSPPALRYAESFDVGSVRLTERFVASDPPRASEIDALRSAAAEAFARVPPLWAPARGEVSPVGVAGTVTTLASIALGLSPYEGARVHGLKLGVEQVREVVGRLSRMDLTTRRGLAGMEPKRADVIVAGGLIALALLEHWRSTSLVVSDRGVRWGLAQELVGAPPRPARGASP